MGRKATRNVAAGRIERQNSGSLCGSGSRFLYVNPLGKTGVLRVEDCFALFPVADIAEPDKRSRHVQNTHQARRGSLG